ncbi:MAG: hypothetical protein R2851_13650 [Caldilineaceae bacterium]
MVLQVKPSSALAVTSSSFSTRLGISAVWAGVKNALSVNCTAVST